MEEYKNEASNVTWHIPSAYTAKLSNKSKCISMHEHVRIYYCSCVLVCML